MLPVFRCVACAGCFALGALLVVTCDVTWAAEPLSVLLLPALLPACVCSGRVTVVGVVVVTCHVACLSMRRAGCRARAALLVVTCDVTWAAEPLSLLLLPALLPACVCSGRVTVVAVVVVTCDVACLSLRRAGCRARAALLVVTCDVTWAAEPLSLLLFLCCYLRVCALGVLPSLLW